MNLPSRVTPQYINIVITKPINLMKDSLEFPAGFFYLQYHHGKVHLFTKHFCAN